MGTHSAFHSPLVRRGSVVLVLILLIGSILGVWRAFSTPTGREERVTLVTYQHDGEFDHQVYAKPGIHASPGEESEPLYFTKIIESTDVSFSYEFVSPEPLTDVREEVEISAVLESERLWQYEVILVPKTTRSGAFTVTFPLEREQFLEVADQIRAEIGTGTMAPDVTLKATVHTVAQADSGVIEDDFVQTAKVKLTSFAVQWDKDLALSQWVLFDGLRYEHQGVFDYTIKLKPNILWGPVTIESNTPAPASPAAMVRSDSYYTASIAYMDATFSYQFGSDDQLQHVSTDVQVTAVLQDPEHWSETIILVPETDKTGRFTITFPLDLFGYYDIIDARQRELSVYAPSHDLVLKAEVHTLAETDFGPIAEIFTQSVAMRLDANAVKWPGETRLVRDGSLMETVTVANSIWPARAGAIVGLLLAVLLGSYVGWNYAHVEPIGPTGVEAEAQRVKRKHKDAIADVEELPKGLIVDTVVPMNSLEDLIKVADALLKPVLHLVEADKHSYCVVDGLTRYEYVSSESPIPEPEEQA